MAAIGISVTGKRGVSFDEAASVFHDEFAAVFDDTAHSTHELRRYIIGWSGRLRLLAVWFTERGGKIRLISAREATPKERRGFENASTR
jgi:uncharacterized DUF497 family protein